MALPYTTEQCLQQNVLSSDEDADCSELEDDLMVTLRLASMVAIVVIIVVITQLP